MTVSLAIKIQVRRSKNAEAIENFGFITGAVLVVFTLGCGGDVSPPTKEETSGPPVGLHDDTYRNQPHVFKVSNLPVDDWTVLSYPEDREKLGKWAKESFEISPYCNRGVDYLLMQPTKDNFQQNMSDAFENQMPFIDIWVEEQNATDVYKLTSPKAYGEFAIASEQGRAEVTDKGEIVSKDRSVGYFYKATILEDGSKESNTYFMRATGEVRSLYVFYFWAPADRYDELKPTYDKIMSSFERNIL